MGKTNIGRKAGIAPQVMGENVICGVFLFYRYLKIFRVA